MLVAAPNVSAYPVEVKPAKTGGVGVFATKGIQRGQICCYYDGVVCHNGLMAILVSGSYHHNMDENHDETGLTIAGFREQLRPGGCGQLCNDAATEYSDPPDSAYWKKVNVEAVQSGEKHTLLLVAKKRIRKGEELLFSYGKPYWDFKRKHEDTDVSTLFRRFVTEKVDRFPLNRNILPFLCTRYDTHDTTLAGYATRFALTMELFSK